jgi:hypothetical protein
MTAASVAHAAAPCAPPGRMSTTAPRKIEADGGAAGGVPRARLALRGCSIAVQAEGWKVGRLRARRARRASSSRAAQPSS